MGKLYDKHMWGDKMLILSLIYLCLFSIYFVKITLVPCFFNISVRMILCLFQSTETIMYLNSILVRSISGRIFGGSQ